jgi:hypothetical protein
MMTHVHVIFALNDFKSASYALSFSDAEALKPHTFPAKSTRANLPPAVSM